MGAYRDRETKGGTFRSRETGKPSAAADFGKSLMSGLGEGVASIADLVMEAAPMGRFSNTLQATARLASGELPGIPTPQNYLTRRMSEVGHQPETRAGRYGKALGVNAPSALVPGGVVRRVANVVLPAVGGESAAETVEAMGAGERGQTAARIAGSLAGAGVASTRVQVRRDAADDVVNHLQQRGKVDAVRAQEEAARLRDAGIEPTLTDVVGERGRRFIRAVGVKDEEAGEALTRRSREVTADAKPAVMERTRRLGPATGKSADEVEDGLRQARDDAADADYKPAYRTKVELTPETLSALNDDVGRAAVRRARLAAVARRDQEQIAELDTLLKMNPPPSEITAGTLDRIRIAMRGRADKLAQSPDTRDIASGIRPRVGDIDTTLDNVPELAPARADYRAKSQAIGVLGKDRQDIFSTDPADYAKWLDSLPAEAREANKVAIRQEIVDTLGGQRASTMGSIDELATSAYARDNLAMALGPEEAGRYLANLQARLEQVRNASFVSPNAGSRTAVLENDLGNLKEVGGVMKDVARRDLWSLGDRALQWFASRGIGEREARQLSELASDPQRLDEVLAHLQRRYGERAAQEFVQWQRALPAALAVTSTVRGQPQER